MDRIRTYTVPKKYSGKRLDRVLRELLPDISLGRLSKLVRKGRIEVNDAKSRHQQRLEEGDVITFHEAPLSEEWTKKGKARVYSSKVSVVDELDFNILFEDEHLIVVSKPPGLLVHGTNREPNAVTLIDQILAYVAQRQIESSDERADDRELGEFVRPSPKFQPSLVHRIDRDTSGAVIIAKTLEALQDMTKAIKKREIDKRYIGLIKGGLRGGEGEIQAPVARRDHAGKKSGRSKVDVGEGLRSGKPATTRYKVLAQSGSFSLVEFELITGRTHQIRAHLRHVGSALIGDDEYGDRTINRYAKDSLKLERQFLHASELRFRHPVTGSMEHIVAPLAPDLSKSLLLAGFTTKDLPEALCGEFETHSHDIGVDSNKQEAP